MVFAAVSSFSQNNDTVFSKLETLNNDSLRITYLLHNGQKLLGRSPDTAIVYLDSAETLSQRSDNCCLCNIYITKANYYKIKSNYKKAEELAKASLECFEKKKASDLNIAPAYNMLGILSFYSGDYSRALQYFRKNEKIYLKHKDTKGLASTYNALAIISFWAGKYDEALEKYKDALELALEENDSARMASVYNNIGLVYKEKGEWKKALDYYFKSLSINIKMNQKEKIANKYNNIGVIYNKIGDYGKSVYYYKKALAEYKAIGNLEGIADQYNNLGLLYFDKGEYVKAVENIFKGVELYQKTGKIISVVNGYINIAKVYIKEKNYDEAIRNLEKAIKLSLVSDLKKELAMAYKHMGEVYSDIGNYNKAFDFLIRAINIHKKIGYQEGLGYSYIEMGSLFTKKGEPLKALAYFNKSKKIFEKINDTKGLVQSLINTAQAYLKAYKMVQNKEFLQKSISNAGKAYKLAEANDYKENILESSKILKDAYRYNSDFPKSLYFSDVYENMRDSVFESKKQKLVLEVQTKYETKQKEQELKLKDEQIARINAEKEKQRLIIENERRTKIIVSIAGTVLLVMLIFIFLSYREKSRLNDLLSIKNHEIERSNKKLSALVDKISKQKNELEAKNKLIEEIHKELKNSIEYAEKIQLSTLPPVEDIAKFTRDYFVIYMPRDIVSGDFYWYAEVDGKIIFAVSDCTGHGVPGAFMSMLGISLLTETVVNRKIIQPAEILEDLKKGIISVLKSEEDRFGQHDGMDMAVITVDKNSGIITFAGANNGIYVVDDDLHLVDADMDKVRVFKSEGHNLAVFELKADKLPVGSFIVNKNFSQVSFKMTRTQKIYMYSDGFIDQFGGTNGKKYKSSRLKKQLLEIYPLPMREQKKYLITALNDWKGDFPQIDDITFIGLKF